MRRQASSMAVQTHHRPARMIATNRSHSILNEAPASTCGASHHDVLTPMNPRPINSIASATISDDQRLADEAGGGRQADECGERVRDHRLCGGRNGRGDRDRENRVPGTSSACLSAAISLIRRGRHWFAACVSHSGVSAQPAYSRTAIKTSAQGPHALQGGRKNRGSATTMRSRCAATTCCRTSAPPPLARLSPAASGRA